VIYCINPWCKSRENDDQAEFCLACSSPLLINGRFRLIRTLYDLNRNHDTDIYEAIDSTGSYQGRGVNTIKILKVLKAHDERFIDIFRQEAETLQSLEHPAIPFVDIEDFFCIHLETGPDDLYCLAMSKMEGVTLGTWIHEHGRINQELAITWIRQLSEILDYVHGRGFVHRDVKPENIIVQPDLSLALIDFGFSQSNLINAARSGNRSSATAYNVRSFGFTAPEQNIGRSYPQSDIYSLGRTMIVALTGKELSELSTDEKSGNLLWHSYAKQIAKPIQRYIDRLIDPAIAKRPKDTHEMLSYLSDVLPGQIKWSQRWKSPYVLYPAIFLGVVAALGSIHFGRLWSSDRFLDVGIDNYNTKQYQTAKENLNISAWINMNEPAYRMLALVCTEIVDVKCTEDNYNKAINVDPENDSPWYNLATYYEDQQNLDKAMQTYKRAIKLKPNDPSTLNNIARLYILKNNVNEAKKNLKNAEKQLNSNTDPSLVAVIFKNKGWISYKLSDYETAKKFLEASKSMDDSIVATDCLLAQVSEVLKQPAKEYWRQCIFLSGSDVSRPEVINWRNSYFDSHSRGK
jgi:serine/threonine protein kinase